MESTTEPSSLPSQPQPQMPPSLSELTSILKDVRSVSKDIGTISIWGVADIITTLAGVLSMLAVTLWGKSLGQPVRETVISVAGFIVALIAHERNANKRAQIKK